MKKNIGITQHENALEMAKLIEKVAKRVLKGEAEEKACMLENVDIKIYRQFLKLSISAEKTTGNAKSGYCWQDAFLSALMGHACYAPEDFDEAFEDVLKNVCTKQEQDVILLKYQRNMSYEKICMELGMSKEEVTKHLKKAMHKMRSPKYNKDLQYGKKYAETMKRIKETESKYEELRLKKIRDLKEKRNANIQYLQEQLEQSEQEMAYLQDESVDPVEKERMLTRIEDMGLSTRAYNALRRSERCKTLLDIANMSKLDLMNIRNIGEITIREIQDVLKNEYDIILK